MGRKKIPSEKDIERVHSLMRKRYADLGIEKESVNEGFTKYHIRLTNTRGWYGVWDKNGKQKFEGDRRYVTRQLKKLKTRMGNFQLKSLIDVATKRKGKNIEFDVVESVNEEIPKPKLYLLKVQTKNLANDVQDLFKAIKDGDEGLIKNELDQVKFRVDMLRKRGLGLKESVNEAKETAIDVAKRVVKNKQHEKGLDLTTANFIVKIYDAYKDHPGLQKQMDKMPLPKMVKLAYKVMK